MTRLLLSLEFLLLFAGLPLFIVFGTSLVRPSVIILPSLMVIFLLLRFITPFRFRELLKFGVERRRILRNGMIIGILSVIMLTYILVFEPSELFNLPRGNAGIWVFLLLFYPIFSAFGQEVIYRRVG